MLAMALSDPASAAWADGPRPLDGLGRLFAQTAFHAFDDLPLGSGIEAFGTVLAGR